MIKCIPSPNSNTFFTYSHMCTKSSCSVAFCAVRIILVIFPSFPVTQSGFTQARHWFLLLLLFVLFDKFLLLLFRLRCRCRQRNCLGHKNFMCLLRQRSCLCMTWRNAGENSSDKQFSLSYIGVFFFVLALHCFLAFSRAPLFVSSHEQNLNPSDLP